ncbi:hypothetical protein Tsubulata_049485, partial [Turnera subulata]
LIEFYATVDHLVSNAGVMQMGFIEDCTQISDFARVMDTNFWGFVNCSRFAVPHLKKSRGRIIVISSACEWLPIPRYGFYYVGNVSQQM